MENFVNVDPKTLLPEDKFIFVPPAEVLRKETLGVVDLGETESGVKIELCQFPDLDGKLIWLPRFVLGTDEVKDRLVSFGAKLDNQFLSKDQKARLLYCLIDLNRSTMESVHLTLNKPDTSLDNYPKQQHSDTDGVAMTLRGFAGTGKSALLAALSLRKTPGLDISSFDTFSDNSWSAYLDYFHSQGLDETSSAEDILQAVARFRQEKTKNTEIVTKKQAKTATFLLDELVAKSLSSDQSKLLIVEGVSAPKAPLDSNILHLLQESFEIEWVLGTENVYVEPKNFGLLTNQSGTPLARPYLWLQEDGNGLRKEDLSMVLENFEKRKNEAVKLAQKLKQDFIKKLSV